MSGQFLSTIVGLAAFGQVVTGRAVPQARAADFSWVAIKYLYVYSLL
jgi:hypothetical protein